MRPKIVIILLLVGVAGFAVILFLKPPVKRPPTAEALVAPPVIPSPETKPASVEVHPPATTPATAAPVNPVKPAQIPFTTPTATGPDAAEVQAQIDRLEDLQSNDDDASLQAILKELTNTNQLIRHTAIEATIQFGGHTAVPVLKDLAARTADPDEKQELLDAAEFLAQPTLSEARAEKEQERMQNPDPPQ